MKYVTVAEFEDYTVEEPVDMALYRREKEINKMKNERRSVISAYIGLFLSLGTVIFFFVYWLAFGY